MTHDDAQALLVSAKLEELAQHCADQIADLERQPAQGHPDVKAERHFFTAQLKAFNKALEHWSRGVRPQQLGSGAYLIPSASRAGVAHRVVRTGHFWICDPTCEAHAFHWHTALMTAIDLAQTEAEPVAERSQDVDRAELDAWLMFDQMIEPDPAADRVGDPFLPPVPQALQRPQARPARPALRRAA